MADRESSSVDSGLLMNERSDNEASEIKEGKKPHVTLSNKEVIEKDANGQLLRRTEEQPEALESVHNYAKRIKSFLGWEPFTDELEKNTVVSTSGTVDRLDVADLDCVDSDVTAGGDDVTEKRFSAVVPHACELDKGEKLDDNIENESDTIGIHSEYENELVEPDDLISENETDDDQKVHGTVDADLGHHYSDLIDNPFENDDNLSGKGDIVLITGSLNTSEKDTSDCSGDCIEMEIGSKSDLVDNDSVSKDCFIENSETFQRVNSENTNTAVENDVKVDGLDAVPLEGNCLIENSKNEEFIIPPEGTRISDSDNTASPETEREKITNASETKDKYGIKTSELSEPNTSENMLVSSDITQFPESPEDISVKNEEAVYSKNIERHNEGYAKEDSFEDNEEDLRSNESFNSNDSTPLKKNFKKPYMDEIRRLSMGIVKDVIESARNSVHEIFANKYEDPEEENASEGSDNLANNNQIYKNGESHFNNGNKRSEEKFSGMTEDSKAITAEHAPNGNNDPSEAKNVDSEEEIIDRKGSRVEDNHMCGIGCFKPRWIQQYSRPKVYLILFSIIGVIHGCYYPYFVSIISTLEKRYAFKTKVSGTLLLADEITPLLLGVIVGYIGSRTHRPRMVAIGMFMSAACCFISGLPYLIYGSAKHLSSLNYKNETGPEFCDVGVESGGCDNDDAPPTLTVVGIFLLASFLKGFATLSYYVIGISYMDDNIKKKNSPLYLAIALALRLLGPLVGFLMSSAFLKLYENPAEHPGYGPDDPRWVGAWWIGFFLQGVLLVIFTLPIALFPRRLPGQRSVATNTAPANEDGLKQIFVGLFSALKRLAKNPVFILLIVNTNMKIFGHFGHSIMLPKYMENQFRLSASEASLYSGATSITFVMLSTIFGGYMIWKFRPRIKILLGGMIVSEVILCVGFLLLIIPRCQIADMMNFGRNEEGLVLSSACNQMCECSTTSYTPFCGPDGTTYFSPCYAGCTKKLISNTSSENHKEFGNCSCLATARDQDLSTIISEGVCPDEECWSQALVYLIIYFILLTVSDTFTVAHSMILLRSVHPNDKSIALGTFETFICLFGFIPFPVTFGALVDSACLVWEKSCGETGNCWFYDMQKYSYLLHGVAALFCSFSALCLIGLYFLSSRVRDLYADEDEETNNYVDIKLDTVSGSVTKL